MENIPAQEGYPLPNVPANINPPPSVPNSYASSNFSPPSSKSKVGIILVFTFFTLFIFFIIGVPAVFLYSNLKIPFISTETRQNILMSAYNIPLIPKTPEQILLMAANNNTKLTRYNPDFSIGANLGNTAVNIVALDFKLNGPVDFSSEKISFDLKFGLGVNFSGTSYQSSGQAKKAGDKVYFKIDNISDSILELYSSFFSSSYLSNFSGTKSAGLTVNSEIKKNIQRVLDNWVFYDTKGMESEARKSLEKSANNQSLIDSTRKNIQEFLLKSKILPQVKKLGDETIDNTPTYHLSFSPSKELLKELITEYYKAGESAKNNITDLNNLTDSLEMMEVDIWFGRKDAILRKLSVKSQMKMDSLLGRGNSLYGGILPNSLPALDTLTSPKLTVNTVLLIKDIGKTVTIDSPSSSISLTDFYTKLMDGAKTEDQKKQELQSKLYNDDFSILSKAIFKYYVENKKYPAVLSDLIPNYIQQSNTVVGRLNNYTYKTSSIGKSFVLYIEYSSSSYTSSYSTPYYGISSTGNFAHQLTKSEFDLVNIE